MDVVSGLIDEPTRTWIWNPSALEFEAVAISPFWDFADAEERVNRSSSKFSNMSRCMGVAFFE